MPGTGQQVEDEDPEVGLVLELLLDPRVAVASDVTVVEVGLGGVDGDDGDAVQVDDLVALAEELLEVDVADVPGVVVARDDDELVAVEPLEVGLGVGVLRPEALRSVRSPEQITISGSSSLISVIARPSGPGTK